MLRDFAGNGGHMNVREGKLVLIYTLCGVWRPQFYFQGWKQNLTVDRHAKGDG